MDKIKISINEKQKEYKSGISLKEIVNDYKNEYKEQIVLGVVDNELKELNTTLSKDCTLDFIDLSSEDGKRTYMRSLSFVFIRACDEIFKDEIHCTIEHSLAKGLYCEVHGKNDLSEEDIKDIKSKMNDIIDNDEEFDQKIVPLKEAIDIFKKQGRLQKVNMLKYKEGDTAKIYKSGNVVDYFYGYLVPSTGYLKLFDIKKYSNGVVLLGPSRENPKSLSKLEPQPKLSQIYKEAEDWAKIMNIDTVAALNEHILNNQYSDLIRTVEALHEKKISQIADLITYNEQDKKIILIAGPSSSGKTSFAQRLSIQLRVNKLRPVSISLDDYFVDREFTPQDEDGNPDFESIYSIDLKLFNEHLKKLILGEEVEIPYFNFKIGKREFLGKKLKIDKDQILLIEGIHGLNELLTSSIPSENKFKIYVSALTQLNLDEHNRIPTTDLRLIRRIVRDNQFRNHDAKSTIKMWASVRKGEEKNIFPYQEEADVMFNSACIYELAVLKKYVVPLLENVGKENKEYIEAKRLLKFLQYFVSIDEEIDIPRTSILKEFIGGSGIVH